MWVVGTGCLGRIDGYPYKQLLPIFHSLSVLSQELVCLVPLHLVLLVLSLLDVSLLFSCSHRCVRPLVNPAG
jgi:hypothetical protein